MSDRYIGGLHAVKAALMSSASEIQCLYVQNGRRDGRLRDLLDLARKQGIASETVNRSALNDLLTDIQHQGVVALLRDESIGTRTGLFDFLNRVRQEDPGKPLLLLMLDEVQDPHNLGACLRSADATGVDAVVAPLDKSVGLTAVTRKVACGAAEVVPFFQVTNLRRTIIDLKALGIWVYGAAGEASGTLYSLDLSGSVALIMGSEGKGLRRLTREQCDVLFNLPMAGQVSSLNVSVAAGVCLYEVVRQRSIGS